MNLHNKEAEMFIPDGVSEQKAISRTTHMTISAHQDDIEIMAYDGIAKCFGRNDKWHFGVVVTNGAGSARNGLYENFSDEQMRIIRKKEQKKAAYVGEYGALALLDYTSNQAKDTDNEEIIHELKTLIKTAKPDVIYTHNLADKHDTHVAVAIKVISSMRQLSKEFMPKSFYGCEVWRGLDWMNDKDKIVFDVDSHPNIASSLVEIFDSQIIGGKRYDKAAIGRRLMNATFSASHATDVSNALSYAMDLTPLIKDVDLDIAEYVQWHIENFRDNVVNKIGKYT